MESKYKLISKYNQRVIDAWNSTHESEYHILDVESMKKDHKPFSKPEINTERSLASSAIFKMETVDLGDGHYSNLYTVTVDENDPVLEIGVWAPETRGYMRNALKRQSDTETKKISLMNGGFFFLVDDASVAPYRSFAYNLCLSNGRINSLPIVDRSAFLWVDGKPRFEFLEARGIVQIGGSDYSWSGSKTSHISDLTLHNISSIEVIKTPSIQNPELRSYKQGTEIVKAKYGNSLVPLKELGTDYVIDSVLATNDINLLKFPCVLEVPESIAVGLKRGLIVKFKDIMGIDLKSIKHGITTGPIFHGVLDELLFNTERDGINSDLSLGPTPPVEVLKRKPRTFMLKTEEGRFVMGIFNGARETSKFKGIKIGELVEQLNLRYGKYEGVILDSGKSSRLSLYDQEGSGNLNIEHYGNLQYGKFCSTRNEEFIWTYHNGRQQSSGITLEFRN